MKKYIYSPHHQGAVLAPLMEKPIPFEEFSIKDEYDLQQHRDFKRLYEQWEGEYNTWLSSPPAFKVRPEDIEWFSVERGEDEFEVEYFVKTESYQGEGGRAFKTLREAEDKYYEWSKYDGKLQSFAYPPQQVAIPKKGNESKEQSPSEFIICSAIWFDDGKEYTHQPKNLTRGFVVAGRRHHNCYSTLQAIGSSLGLEGIVRNHIERIDRDKQGFITSLNRYVDRKEGFKIAAAARQLINPELHSHQENPILTSEDLW
jgi:hypothetical protein